MTEILRHRGPDDADSWIDEDAGIAIGHRRLSVIDLSSAGRQPMLSVSGRYVIAFNGEIYNCVEMRAELERAGSAPAWRGHSDTEILLAAIDKWGFEQALKKSVGMFAIVLWDRERRTLALARDRVGEKPLYYGWQNGCFLFGSELKALRAHPAFCPEIDRDVLALYLRLAYIPAPHSIYADVFKLPPGTFLQLGANASPGALPAPQPYWSLKDIAERGIANPFKGDEEEAADELDRHLRNAVSLQSIADVPLGAFLSGGIDSSTIVSIMQQQSAGRVKTFTIGFHEDEFSEAGYAKQVAQHLGTEHTELYVTPREAMDVIPDLPVLYDEPFGDSSAIPTFLVSQLARRHVTVSLSGDGGDELFGGYTRYQRTHDFWQKAKRVPFPVRSAASRGLSSLSRHGGLTFIGWKADRLSHYLSARRPLDFYAVQTALRHDENELVLGCKGELPQPDTKLANGMLYDDMMFSDAVTYLPDDILVKVDRASMGVSLESRVPMLDHRVLEFAWQLPLPFKVRNGEGKWLLKKVLRKYLPSSLVDRPKMGFGVPIGEWIRDPLRDWAEDLVSEYRLRQQEYLDARLVREQWTRHLKRASGGDDSIWPLLMFQQWLSTVDSPASAAKRQVA